jgi:hypothetical protein
LDGRHAQLLYEKRRSLFCLEPAGDTHVRKSISDSVGLGCIPVFFHEFTAHAYATWVSDRGALSAVAVPRAPFVAGAIDLHALLGAAPPSLVQRMQCAVRAEAHHLQLSLADDSEDMVPWLLARVAAHAAGRADAAAHARRCVADAHADGGPPASPPLQRNDEPASLDVHPSSHPSEAPRRAHRAIGANASLGVFGSRCKCTFVDIGMNNGDTLLHWWRGIPHDALPPAQSRRLHACAAQPKSSQCYFGMEANPRWSGAGLTQCPLPSVARRMERH